MANSIQGTQAVGVMTRSMVSSRLDVTPEGYDRMVRQLASIIKASKWDFDHIICIGRGGLPVGAQLSHLFNKELGVLFTSSYRGEEGKEQGELKISRHIAMIADSLGKRILLVDDLADSGKTQKFVKEHLQKNMGVQEVRTAVLWMKTCTEHHPNYFVDVVYEKTWITQPFEVI